MTSLATQPLYPIPGHDVATTFTLTESGANFIRVWCTIAPADSDLDKEIKKAATSQARVKVYEGDAGTNAPWRHTFDKGGKYTLVAQEYTKGTGVGGGYQDDDRANAEETALAPETTLTLSIGKRIEHKLGTGADAATLAFYLFGDTIRSTTLATHGEATPAVLKPSSARSKNAATNSGVTSAIAALADVDFATALGDVSTVAADFLANVNAHFALTAGSVHANADSDNVYGGEQCSPPNQATLSQLAIYTATRLIRHEMNDSGTGIGSAASKYHSPSGNDTGDLLNQPLVKGVSGPEDSYAALADLWVAYEAHRVSLVVHGAADNTNALATLPKLLDVHRYFFSALRSLTPTAVPGDSSAAALAKSWGMKET